MKRFVFCLASLALVFGGVRQVTADIVFSKPNDPTQFVAFSDSDGQQVADNLVLATNETINTAEWFGGYDSISIDATTSRSFKIRFFNDSGGMPAITPFAETTVSVGGVDTGTDSSFTGTDTNTLGNRDIFKYSAPITDVPLTAGTTYWFSVLENDLSTGNWFWQASNFVADEDSGIRPGDDVAWNISSVDNINEFAFSLGADSEVLCEPEPKTQGFWRRVCKKPHPEIPEEQRQQLITLLLPDGTNVCDALQAKGNARKNPCVRARSQFAALILNVAAGFLSISCEVDNTTVGDLIGIVGDLIDDENCKEAADLAEAANSLGTEAAPPLNPMRKLTTTWGSIKANR